MRKSNWWILPILQSFNSKAQWGSCHHRRMCNWNNIRYYLAIANYRMKWNIFCTYLKFKLNHHTHFHPHSITSNHINIWDSAVQSEKNRFTYILLYILNTSLHGKFCTSPDTIYNEHLNTILSTDTHKTYVRKDSLVWTM